MDNVFRNYARGILIICLVLSGSVMGSELDISGFFDVVGGYQNSYEDKTSFGLGQAELDLENQINDKALASIAVCYNNETGGFELGAATIELNLFENENRTFTSASITAGQFDVPFGIDYNVYASIDRKLVTAPLAVDYTHEGWNDFGVQLNINWKYGNIVAYGVNGFESSYKVSDFAHSLSLGLSIGDEVNTTPANAFGARFGLTPFQGLEIGGSAAFGLNESNLSEMHMIGGDLQYSVSNFSLKGEYIQHSLNRSIEEEMNQGYYVQGLYNINKFFVTGRYGAFQPDGDEWANRYSFGVGYGVSDGVEIRFESNINQNSNDDSNILQIVASF